MAVRGIDHVGVTVPEIGRATAFFAAVLDARVLYDALRREDGPNDGPATERRLGEPQPLPGPEAGARNRMVCCRTP
ncbi:hypothetical protein [Actinomadura parmotrematis]|uniref:VOC domain-containing protein n=1 Tax=Actinomadura parmotrematis TaxID=2864039 RepID=A0ABS7FPJ1_9ACTN|nr:hypothetical protein [Actinomadura parmotrematis]MBW8482308.1 hypothetical protein [Actinomadura parmotrematis]